MIATKPRTRSAAPLCAGVAGSAVLHVALFAVAAAIPAGLLIAQGAEEVPDRPLTVTIAVAPQDPAPVAGPVETIPAARVPPPRPETIEIPEWTPAAPPRAVGEPIGCPAAPPREADCAPVPGRWSRLTELASLRPGHGAAGRGAAGSRGRGTIGVGGTGGASGDVGGAGGGGTNGAAPGSGSGDGGDGTGSGWAPRGGETRGPAIVSPLATPSYPPKARAHGWEGRVVLVLTIDDRGRVTAVEVAESSGRESLDEAAREAAAAWTLAPALRDGSPVAGTLRVPVRFELTD
jgi:periplasmic protein TonB